LVAGGDEAKNGRLDVGLLGCGVQVAVTEVLVKGSGELKSVDELRVETGCDLNTHTADKEVEVHLPQVRLLVPRHLVLLHHTGNDRVGAMTGVCWLEDTHDGSVNEGQPVVVTFAKLCG
jgi:hypothetical protein